MNTIICTQLKLLVREHSHMIGYLQQNQIRLRFNPDDPGNWLEAVNSLFHYFNHNEQPLVYNIKEYQKALELVVLLKRRYANQDHPVEYQYVTGLIRPILNTITTLSLDSSIVAQMDQVAIVAALMELDPIMYTGPIGNILVDNAFINDVDAVVSVIKMSDVFRSPQITNRRVAHLANILTRIMKQYVLSSDMTPLIMYVSDGIQCVFVAANQTYYVDVCPQYSILAAYTNLLGTYLEPEQKYVPYYFQVCSTPFQIEAFLQAFNGPIDLKIIKRCIDTVNTLHSRRGMVSIKPAITDVQMAQLGKLLINQMQYDQVDSILEFVTTLNHSQFYTNKHWIQCIYDCWQWGNQQVREELTQTINQNMLVPHVQSGNKAASELLAQLKSQN